MSQYLSWHVGMKVVCVDDAINPNYTPWRPTDDCLDGLTRGKIYTVRRIADYYGQICIWLEEITRPRRGRTWSGDLPEEAGYSPWRFRPVQSRKTDISIFTAMLNPAKKREVA